MILSISRRTDIPALYWPWLLERIRAGYVLVPNPFDARAVRRVDLAPEGVDCMIFWTKNAAPALDALEGLRGYNYGFHFTLNGYGRELEPSLPPLSERIDTFRRLAARIGAERVVWRYDPVLLTGRYTVAFHLETFARLARALAGSTFRCILGLLEPYRHIRHRMERLGVAAPAAEQATELARSFAATARAEGIALASCGTGRLSEAGIPPGACIDRAWAELLAGYPLDTRKDRNQRPACLCAQSIDIGVYGTCTHGCAYCYALRGGPAAALAARARHDPAAPMLTGVPPTGARIVDCPMPSLRRDDPTLF